MSHPASNIPVSARNHTPHTKISSRFDSLRSKLEQSVDPFIMARRELEEILSAEGSSEQGRFFTRSSTDLQTELKRQKATSTVESSLRENEDPKHYN